LAIGSSSTAGEGGIVPFPARLELALRRRYYGRMIDVINRGIGGQEAPSELSRFECDVLAESPTLVIWQVGTNAVFRKVDFSFDDVQAAIAVGLEWLAGLPTDVVLMDLQYTIKIDALNLPPGPGQPPLADDIEARIALEAEKAKVNVFKRWALMKQWVKDGLNLDELTDPNDTQDHLHMSEWATGCLSTALDAAIGTAVGPLLGAAPVV
jgi:hypothetical protein